MRVPKIENLASHVSVKILFLYFEALILLRAVTHQSIYLSIITELDSSTQVRSYAVRSQSTVASYVSVNLFSNIYIYTFIGELNCRYTYTHLAAYLLYLPIYYSCNVVQCTQSTLYGAHSRSNLVGKLRTSPIYGTTFHVFFLFVPWARTGILLPSSASYLRSSILT